MRVPGSADAGVFGAYDEGARRRIAAVQPAEARMDFWDRLLGKTEAGVAGPGRTAGEIPQAGGLFPAFFPFPGPLNVARALQMDSGRPSGREEGFDEGFLSRDLAMAHGPPQTLGYVLPR
jgi:hypothetical protein